jgi:hypothetical protein
MDTMFELRWTTPEGMITKRPVLQFRTLLAIDASGAFCPGAPSEWKDVPIAVVPREPAALVCPRCGADRTKEACPQGYGASLDRRCPMSGLT